MESREFARQVGSWIPPFQIGFALWRYEHEFEQANQSTSVVLSSHIIETADEGGLKTLVETFLHNFRICDEVLQLLPAFFEYPFGADAKDWLKRLAFEGSIEALDGSITNEDYHGVLAISERDVFLDLVLQPLRMLAATVSHYAKDWKEAQKGAIRDVYLQHSANSPLAVQIESAVSSAYGYPAGAAGILTPTTAIKWNYRSITLVLNGIPDAVDIEVATSGARSQADETREPI